MKAISLWQPWASALFAPLEPGKPHAIKLHETRHWEMPAWLVNETVAIHAAKRDTKAERKFWTDVVMYDHDYLAAFLSIGIDAYESLPRGSIVGTVIFGPSKPTTGWKCTDDATFDWGNYSDGRWAWPVIQHRRLATPIPCLGRQGFFNVELTPQFA